MANVLDQAIKFRYGSIDQYNAAVEAGRIKSEDVYFVVADDSTNGFLYLNGQAFGAGVLDVSVSEVVDSSFNITITKINKDNGAVEDDVINIPFSDPGEYTELVQRVASLESSVGSLESSVGGLETSVGDLRDDVDVLKDKMGQLFGTPEYPDASSDGILQAIVDQIVDVSNLADELNASVKDHEDRIDDLEASVASLDASVTNIYQEFYPVVERIETLETSVNTIETRVETLETVVEHSVGDVSLLNDFNYIDASSRSYTAQNVVELALDASKNASLGVFIDGKFLTVAEVSAGAETREVLTVNTAEIQAAVVDVPVYAMTKLDNPNEGYVSSYRLTVTQSGSTSAAGVDINIPKDLLVRSAELKTVAEADVPYEGAVVGDKYIDFVIYTADPSAATGEHIYLPVNDLVDVYTVANDSSKYLDINAQNEISFDADEVVKYVDSSLKVTEKFTQVDGSISDISTRLNTLDGTVSDLSTNVYRKDYIDASYTALNSSISAMELKWLEI